MSDTQTSDKHCRHCGSIDGISCFSKHIGHCHKMEEERLEQIRQKEIDSSSCKSCEGSGGFSDVSKDCPACNGTGNKSGVSNHDKN